MSSCKWPFVECSHDYCKRKQLTTTTSTTTTTILVCSGCCDLDPTTNKCVKNDAHCSNGQLCENCKCVCYDTLCDDYCSIIGMYGMCVNNECSCFGGIVAGIKLGIKKFVYSLLEKLVGKW